MIWHPLCHKLILYHGPKMTTQVQDENTRLSGWCIPPLLFLKNMACFRGIAKQPDSLALLVDLPPLMQWIRTASYFPHATSEFVQLHMDDSAELRDKIVVLRDSWCFCRLGAQRCNRRVEGWG